MDLDPRENEFVNGPAPAADPREQAFLAEGQSKAAAAAPPAPNIPAWVHGLALATGMGIRMPDGSVRNPREEMALGALKGASDIGNTLLNAAHVDVSGMGALDRSIRDRSNRDFETQYGKNGYATVGRIGGSTALTAPVLAEGGLLLGANRLIGPALNIAREVLPAGKIAVNSLTGASQGAASAAALSGGYDQPLADQLKTGTGVGAVLGPLAPLVQKYGGKIYRSLADNFKSEAGPAANPLLGQSGEPLSDALKQHGIEPHQLSPAVQADMGLEAAKQEAAFGKIDADALARKANQQQLGLTPTTATVTRDGIQWAKEAEKRKQEVDGAPLRTVFEKNAQTLKDHLQKIADATGGVTNDAYDAGKSVIDAAKAKWGEWQGEISQAYKTLADQFGNKPAVQFGQLVSDLEPQSHSTAGAPIVTAVKNRMRYLGLIDKDGNATDNAVSVADAEELRKFIGAEGGKDASSKRIVTMLQQSLDNDVFKHTGSEGFRSARQMASNRFGEFESSRALDDVVSDKAAPDTFLDRYVFSKAATAEDLTALKNSLTTGNALQMQRGTQAWNDLRNETAKRILNMATNGNPDEGIISYSLLKKAMAAIGPQKLSIMFGDDGMRHYTSLLAATRDTLSAPPASPVNHSNTANEAVNRITDFFKKHGMSDLPMLGAAAHGEPALAVTLKGATAIAGQLSKRAEAKASTAFVKNALLASSVPVDGNAIGPEFTYNPLIGSIVMPGAIAGERSSNP